MIKGGGGGGAKTRTMSRDEISILENYQPVGFTENNAKNMTNLKQESKPTLYQTYRSNPSAPPLIPKERPQTTLSRDSKTAFDCLAKNECSQNSSSLVNFDQSLIQGTPPSGGIKSLRKTNIQLAGEDNVVVAAAGAVIQEY